MVDALREIGNLMPASVTINLHDVSFLLFKRWFEYNHKSYYYFNKNKKQNKLKTDKTSFP